MSAQPNVVASPMDQVVDQVAVLARKRERLGVMVTHLNRAIQELKTDALPEIRAAIAEATQAWNDTVALVQAHPELFAPPQPRTVEAHGIKVGVRQSPGYLQIADAARTVELIKRHKPDDVSHLVITTETPSKNSLALLTAAELKQLGVSVVPGSDVVVIKPADGDIDKLVRALIESGAEG